MSPESLLLSYKQRLINLRIYTKNNGLSDGEFETLFNECLNSVKHNKTVVKNKSKKYVFINFLFIFTFFVFFLYIINYLLDGKPFSLVFCNIQEFIYPGLRLLRIISIPIISSFPSLTDLYDETCLVQNPFFRIADMDCWPCKSLTHITELKSVDFEPSSSPPFIYKTLQKEVSFVDLQNVYKINKNVFDKDASKIVLNNKRILPTSEFYTNYDFNGGNSANSFVWRINRMFPAQLIRTIFPRPDIIPRLGLSTERFVIIDEPNSKPYKLPDTECNFVFIIQSQGERLIDLIPASECTEHCNPLTYGTTGGIGDRSVIQRVPIHRLCPTWDHIAEKIEDPSIQSEDLFSSLLKKLT